MPRPPVDPQAPDRPCPCGRTGVSARPARVLPYGQCCGRWHAGPLQGQAPDAETLMRSRYSAFVLGLPDYLLATWHASTRPTGISANEPGLQWLGLMVRSHRTVDERHATVAFVARSRLAGRAHRLEETSRFVREADGRWYYVDGDVNGVNGTGADVPRDLPQG